MPIEFRCTQCNRLLQTPDDSAGKDSQCPQCGTRSTVPAGPSGADPLGSDPAAAGGSPPPGMKNCPFCTEPIAVDAVKCKHCGSMLVAGHGAETGDSTNRIAAGVCGILIGSLGVHKFILGLTTPGIIMLLVTLLTCGIGGAVMGVIGLIEGIIYLTKSDEEFYQTYIVEKKGWF